MRLALLIVGLIVLVSGSSGVADEPSAGSGKGEKTSVAAGECRDENGRPLEGVEVQLLRSRTSAWQLPAEVVETVHSDGRGRFRMKTPIPPITHNAPQTWTVIAHALGRASEARSFSAFVAKTDALEFELRPGATVEGVVRDSDGLPVEGARVRFAGDSWGGIFSDVTDKNGRYQVTDLRAGGMAGGEWRRFFTVDHPRAGLIRAECDVIPSVVDIALTPPATIQGRVIDDVTGKAAEGVIVFAQGHKEHGGTEAITDSDGRYLLRLAPADRYNVMVHPPAGRTAKALEGVELVLGKTLEAADLRLIRGAIISGRLIDEATDKAPEISSEEVASVSWHGPDRPRSSASPLNTLVQPDGTFLIRVPPGRVYPYFQSRTWEQPTLSEGLGKGLEVKEGEVTTHVISVRRRSRQVGVP